jgi:hypothetical protein
MIGSIGSMQLRDAHADADAEVGAYERKRKVTLVT